MTQAQWIEKLGTKVRWMHKPVLYQCDIYGISPEEYKALHRKRTGMLTRFDREYCYVLLDFRTNPIVRVPKGDVVV